MRSWESRAAVALLVVTVLCWLPVMGAGFVWDDQGLVVRNTLTGDLRNLPRFFAMDLWDSAGVGEDVSGYYRPLMLASLAVDRALWGLSPVGHHLHSLAWHLLAVAGGFQLLRARLTPAQATLAVGLFALHPVQSEAVVWVAARNDPMAAALGLWALHQVAFRAPTLPRMVAAFALSTLAGFAKESVILLPLLLALVDLVEARRPDWRRHLPLLAGIAVVAASRAAAGVGAATWPTPLGWHLLFARTPELLLLSARLLWLPTPLAAGYALEWLDRLPGWMVAAGGLGLVGSIALLWRSRHAGRLALLGPGWLVVTLVPLALPLADKGLFGDRYLYLGVLGAGVTLALAVRRPLHVAAALALPALVLLQVRLSHWTDEITLWENAVADFPSPYTQGGLGHAYRNEGRLDDALARYIAALDDPLPDVSVCPQMVRVSLDLGKPALAAQLGHWGDSRGCAGALFVGHHALALALSGEWETAWARTEPAPEDAPDRLHIVRTAVLLRQGDLQGAREAASLAEDPVLALDQAQALAGGP